MRIAEFYRKYFVYKEKMVPDGFLGGIAFNTKGGKYLCKSLSVEDYSPAFHVTVI